MIHNPSHPNIRMESFPRMRRILFFDSSKHAMLTNLLRKKAIPLVALLIATATAALGADELTTFEQRRQWILDTVTANPDAWIRANRQTDNPFFAASACFEKGMDEKGRDLAKAGYRIWTANPKPNWHGNNMEDRKTMRVVDFFRLWTAMDCYVRNKEKLDEESKAAFKKLMTSIDFYAYSTTSNLNMMMWTARHLGEQEWGEEAFVPLVRDTTSHYKANPDIPFRRRLLDQLTDIARTGGPEYGSRPYGTANLAPILTLSSLSKDPEIKRAATIAHEAVLARYASVWLRGSLILSSRRSYPDTFNDPVGLTSYLWVFFGGDLISANKAIIPDTPMFNVYGPCLDAAVLGRDIPDILQRIATERTQPFEVRNRFEPRSSGRQISWVDRDFGVFSEAFHTKPRPFSQTYPYGVRWIKPGSGHHTMLWFSVPSLDKADYQRISHPHGFNLNAQSTMQHRGSILYVVDTERDGKTAEFPYGLCFVPGGALATIDESKPHGRVFLHYPGVFIAITATKSFDWDRKAPIRMPNASFPNPEDSEFRISGPRFAAAIETAPERDFPAPSPELRLKGFRDAVVANSKVELIERESFAGRYTDRSGQVFERKFAGAARINGEAVDFDKWPMTGSIWVNQATQDSPLTACDGRRTRTYDFDTWTISEEDVTGDGEKTTPAKDAGKH